MVRRSGVAVVAMLVLVAVAALAAVGSAAKPTLKAPKAGTWNLIAAENTPGGVKVLGGVVGSFRVVGETVKGFHLTFVESGESLGCAGGEYFEGKGEDKKATIKFAVGASAPIVKTTSGYLIAVGAGTGVQGAEVPVVPPVGSADLGTIYATLVPRKKKEPRRGSISWGECNVAFIAKPAGG
jgi:hypothetical protein